MLYEEARVYLDQVSKYGSVLGLESIRDLLNRLGNPQNKLEFVHIAGTNGKGSVLAYVSTILKEAGYKTGRYISPTVMEYLERFQINGEHIGEAEFAQIVTEVKRAAEQMEAEGKVSPTVFEMETAIAFLYFAEQECDIVVLETGLGGLLDATNIIEHTKVCVFASISRDHIDVLGETLPEIAANKAGIIKKGAVVVTTKQAAEAKQVLLQAAEEKKCPFISAEPEQIILYENSLDGQVFSYKEYKNLKIHLLGKYQLENAMTALEVITVLNKSGMTVSMEAVKAGLENTNWPGRFQILQKSPLIIVDGAHNIDAIRRLVENIQIYLRNKRITAIMGVFKDKEYSKMVKMIAPYLNRAYAVDLPNSERTLSKEALRKEFEANGIIAETAENHIEALKKAEKIICEDDVIIGFGSLSYLGDMIRQISGKEV